MHQHVALAAGRELQRARRIEVAFADRRGVAGDRLVVQPPAAALDQLARLGAAFGQAGLVQELEGGDAGGEPRARHADGRQRVGPRAFLEGAACGFGGILGRLPAVRQRRDLGGEDLLGLVDLLALQRLEPRDLVERHLGEELQEAADVVVLGVAPVLPEVIGRDALGVQPHGAGHGLAHLRARRGGDQRRRHGEQVGPRHAPAEIDAHDDVAPLVRAAHLQDAVLALVQLDEVVGLQDHVVEFEEAERLVALEAQLHRVHAEHAVDREVPADLAQHRDVEQGVEPVGIVDHDRVGRPVAELQVLREDLLDAQHVGADLLVGEQRARLVAERRVADLGGAAAHQGDRPMAGLLPPAQHHDLQQRADMQRIGGAVEADIGRADAARELLVEPRRVAALMDHAALVHDPHEIRLEGRHLFACCP